MKSWPLSNILRKSKHCSSLSREEIAYLLSLTDPESIQRVMSAAQGMRRQYFGDKIFLYGFIYLSTYCRNQCAFCFFRRSNEESPRYRKNSSEVVKIADSLVESGVHLVDLTLGEDPLIHETGDFEILYGMISGVKENSGIPVMISPGVVPDAVIRAIAELGADWYALYQETHNRDLFQKLRTNQDFQERITKRETAGNAGLLVEDGILLGVGETPADRADSILSMIKEGAQQVRVMSFVPQPATPFASRPSPPRIAECLCIAVMRLAMPDRLIPASLDVDGIKGLRMRLEAGANVVTSIIPPHTELAGVAQSCLDVEQGRRTVDEAKKILVNLGLSAASCADYQTWIATQKEKQASTQG